MSVAVISLIVSLKTCAKTSAGKTPLDTFESIQNNVAGEDWNAMYDIISPSLRRDIERGWKLDKKDIQNSKFIGIFTKLLDMDRRSVAKMSFKEAWMSYSKKRRRMISGPILKTEMHSDGESCTLIISDGAGGARRLTLRKENGLWYLDPMGISLVSKIGFLLNSYST